MKTIVAACGAAICAGSPAAAQPFANARESLTQYFAGELAPAADCERLAVRAVIADVVELAAESVPAAGSTPAHCRVSGVLDPEIAFEVRLPRAWNGRLYMIGNGGHAGEAAAASGPGSMDFLRLFMIPGMAHCAGGLGPDQYDAVTAVVDWVEKGVAPESLVAKKIVNGSVTRSRPLCPYPQVARYRGRGSVDDAASFECRIP